MNCTICGSAFTYGPGNLHKSCREIEAQRITRDDRIDALLAMNETAIDDWVMRHRS
jgi:hypothetical protein